MSVCARFGLLVLVLIGAPFSKAESQEERVVVDTILGDDFSREKGIWRTKILYVFDERALNLIARSYSVFDSHPSRNLDFVWTPSQVSSDHGGRISGFGRLVWRARTGSPRDPSSIDSVYVGHVRDGRPNGLGRYVSRDNVVYDGSWKNGRFNGEGTLQLPTGEFYQGSFVEGRAAGVGKYIDATGEIFEGRFVSGLREGLGKTTLPGGSIYQSVWRNGTELPGSKRIRIAQTGGQISGATHDDVRLGVTVLSKPTNEVPARESLGYVGTAVGNKITVRPDDPQLLSVWMSQGTIQSEVAALKDEGGFFRQSLFGFDRNGVYPPKLAFDFQNRTATRIEIKGFYLDVSKSESENRPALDLLVATERESCGRGYSVSTGRRRDNGNFAPYFGMNNFGWGRVENGTLRFDFSTPGKNAAPQSMRFTKAVGTFQNRTNIDVSDAIAQAGANLTMLKRFKQTGFTCEIDRENGPDKPKNLSQCLDALKKTGAFGNLSQSIGLDGIEVVTALRGIFEYQYQDASGRMISVSSPLNINITIGGLTQAPECGEGSGPEPIRDKPITLRLDQGSYRIQLPISTSTIDAGHSRQFVVALNAPKSSHHDLQLVAVLTDGREIRSRPIDLLYFLPSWYPKTLY
ncbi:MORN repeat-containing protein [Bradyrhizobium erythrophlei]|uniref:Uncharacterized conserved protein n=1 Tax=Bradyrhizobium erythrophlei TaxID=1437360 RepID=A0A1M5Y7F9_9BRAD|nr:hypothetical protein [Bradyrhizobium erythrophlei]SHI08020.1 Uncharacterized conserved protein [Bradyrhizobium erythrophlei]